MAVIINPNIHIGDITHIPNIVIAYLVLLLLMAESFLTTLSTHRVNKKPKKYIIIKVKYIIKLFVKYIIKLLLRLILIILLEIY